MSEKGGVDLHHVDLDPEKMSRSDIYKIMSGAIVPRPIAWVSTRSLNGVVNLAPFSAYTMISQDPPLLLFQADSLLREKDTIRNIRDTGEFVVNSVNVASLDAMHATSEALTSTESEADRFNVAVTASEKLSVPRIAQVPVSFECRTERMFEIGNEPHVVVIGQVVWIHVAEALLVSGRIDQTSLDPIGRIGGPEYVSLKERFYRPAR